MRKILLFIEDYQEMTSLHSLLVKFGWDVKGIQKLALLSGEILNFAPDAIIATANGSQVKGEKLASKIKGRLPKVKMFLICKDSSELAHIDVSEVSGAFLKPLDHEAVIRNLAHFSGKRKATIIERFEKIFGSAFEEQQTASQGPSRQEVFDQWLMKVSQEEGGSWQPQEIKNQRKVAEEKNKNLDLDESKKEFVKKLFSAK